MPAVRKPRAKPSRQVTRAAARKAEKAAEQTAPPPVIEGPAPGELPPGMDAAPDGPKEQPDGVLVHRIDDGQGGFRTQVQVVGDVRITEIETILKVGLRGFRADLGLTD